MNRQWADAGLLMVLCFGSLPHLRYFVEVEILPTDYLRPNIKIMDLEDIEAHYRMLLLSAMQEYEKSVLVSSFNELVESQGRGFESQKHFLFV